MPGITRRKPRPKRPLFRHSLPPAANDGGKFFLSTGKRPESQPRLRLRALFMAHLCKPGPGAVHGSALQNGRSLERGYRLCFAHKSLPGVETRLFFARKPNKTEAFPDRTPQKPLHHSPFPEIPSFDTTARRRRKTDALRGRDMDTARVTQKPDLARA